MLGIKKLLTRLGFKRKEFSVAFSFFNVSDVKHFVAREAKLLKIHKILKGNGFC
jgi:hypothetical protein